MSSATGAPARRLDSSMGSAWRLILTGSRDQQAMPEQAALQEAAFKEDGGRGKSGRNANVRRPRNRPERGSDIGYGPRNEDR